MASSIASWPERITAVTRDPLHWLADGLAGSGLRWWFALLTVPLWLTPSLYDKYLRPSKVRSGRSALWAGAKLWLGTMTLMGLPLASLLQAPLAVFGRRLGYWDDMFSTAMIALLVTTIFFFLLVVLAAAEWLLVWMACGIDALFGGRTILPPPFGYMTTKLAGAIAGIAASTSALAFSIKPLNEPLWQWLDRGGSVQVGIFTGISAGLLTGFNRKTRMTQICDREIYGNGHKALAYRLGSIIVMVAAAWSFVAYRNH